MLNTGKSLDSSQEVLVENPGQSMEPSSSLSKLGLGRDCCSQQPQQENGRISDWRKQRGKSEVAVAGSLNMGDLCSVDYENELRKEANEDAAPIVESWEQKHTGLTQEMEELLLSDEPAGIRSSEEELKK